MSDPEEDYAQLSSRCYEGFPSATDGIFDAYALSTRMLREAVVHIRVNHNLRAHDKPCDTCRWLDDYNSDPVPEPR